MSEGMKFDGEKARMDLLPFPLLEDVADVLTFGAKKYAPDNWVKVEDGESRYKAGMLRHLAAIERGEHLDPESGLPHVDHLICCALFMSHFNKVNYEARLIQTALEFR